MHAYALIQSSSLCTKMTLQLDSIAFSHPFTSIDSTLHGMYIALVMMPFPRTFDNDGPPKIMMIHFGNMTTSNMMLDNAWMNIMQNGQSIYQDDFYKAT